MGWKHVNEEARRTGKTQEEVLREVAEVLGIEAERSGLRKWVDMVRRPFRRQSEVDKENRRIFEANKARDAAAAEPDKERSPDGGGAGLSR